MSQMWRNKLEGNFQYPNVIIAEFCPSVVCEHGLVYDPSDLNLKLITRKVLIFSEDSEVEKEIEMYGRPSIGNFSQNCTKH